ncbi:LTA synthase family protein [Marinomonas balearica]|uniref:Putative sulfatase n=1 Tax=Marinomonas balearica TaxID=491947 RepID=A0A4R6M6E3_9GAMM|nr:LTA synthase family protein [Marinomonas balearica]TDO96951.1 putative sulfatase [Marinomonas balearica]
MYKTRFFFERHFEISPFLFFGFCLLGTLLGFSATRLVFFELNSDYFVHAATEHIWWAFVHGVRFDLSLSALINAPLLIFLLLTIWFNKLTQVNLKCIFLYFIVVDIPALIINVVDSAYFPYTGRRSGPEVFAMAGDLASQFPEILFVYWQYIAISFVVFVIFTWLFLKLKERVPCYQVNFYMMIFLSVFIFISAVAAARGGAQSKPIRSLTAYSSPSPDLGPLVLNTPFSLLKEDLGNLKKVKYFNSKDEIIGILTEGEGVPRSHITPEVGSKNVVIVILESFGLEYFGPPYGKKSYAPFLQSLAEKGRFFPNGIANGRRSIEAIPSIMLGLPSLMTENIMKSPYQTNTLHGLGELVKEHGYSTAFFHGAKNGSMYFDDTTYRFGFDHYFGRNEYPDSSDFDGQWGIFDEPFLQFTVSEIDKLPKPFVAGIFTISSHTPYTLPAKYQDKFLEADIPMHRVIQYSDMALEQFFETAKTKDWYNDTLFVLLADHTSDNFDRDFSTPLGRHQIPIILYQPQNEIEGGVSTAIAQQANIPATVVDYLHIPSANKLSVFSHSLLRNNGIMDAVIKEEEAFWILSENKFVKLSLDKTLEPEHGILPSTFAKYDGDTDDLSFEDLEERLKAYLQVYNIGLIDNSLYLYSK